MDNITLILTRENAGNSDLLSEAPQFLDNPIEGQFNGIEYVKGNLGHLQVNVSHNRLKIQNSLSKYYAPNDLFNLTRQDIQKAIQSISDRLHLNIENATVTKLEVPLLLDLDNPIEIYLPIMGNHPRLTRYYNPHGINYQGKVKEFVLYSKSTELVTKQTKHLIQDKNILKMENRYKTSVANQFNTTELTARMLYDPTVYRFMYDALHKDFKAVRKQRKFTTDLSGLKSVKDLNNYSILTFIEKHGGETETLNLIKHQQKIGAIDRVQALKLRTKIKSVSQNKLLTTQSPLVKELNSKVNDKINELISE